MISFCARAIISDSMAEVGPALLFRNETELETSKKEKGSAVKERAWIMKKAWNVVKNIFTWAVILIAVGMMIFTIVSVNTFDRADRNLFGYKAFIVLSDSMSATDFSAGDLVLGKEVDPATLREGDIISFSSQNTSNFGEIVTHKIRKVTTDENGDTAFVTYGTTTNTDDESLVTFPFVIGKYQTRLPGVGKFFTFLKTVPCYICCILTPFIVLIVLQLINFIKIFRAYKKEQMADLTREREQIAEERKKSEAMMNELLALKAQLDAQKGAPPASEAAPAEAPPAETDKE